MARKMFRINYNGKYFDLFTNENHHISFLEVVDGKYIMPCDEDIAYLNGIYNNYDHTIKYNRGLRYKVCTALALVLLSTEVGLVGKTMSNISPVAEKSIELSIQRFFKDEFNSREQLDLFYGDEVITREDVLEVIHKSSMDNHFKNIAIDVLDLNLKLDPEINLRIYYENLKSLNIIIDSLDEISKNHKNSTIAYFSVLLREMHLCESDKNLDSSVAHEFFHAVHNIIDINDSHVLFINDERGFALEEAMTQRLTGMLYGHDYSYELEQRMLDFFMDNVDNFDYHVYNTKGIKGLIDELKEKYPNIDIDYLIDYIDTYTKSNNNSNTDIVYLYQDEEFCNVLFDLALSNIDMDDVYGRFYSFINAFAGYTNEEYYNKYYEMYSQHVEMLKGKALKKTLM